jgi:chemotaxis methyl-accepting protein methylase
MALFSSDNNDKKLSQGSQVKSSSLLSSKNADGSASNRVTSTVKTLNPRSSSPFATSSTAKSSSFTSTTTRPTGVSTQTTLSSTRPLGSTLDSTAQSSVARAQSSSTLNRSTLGNSTLRPSASATSTATPSSFGSTAPRSFFDTSSSLASRPSASSSLSSTTRPANTLFSRTTTVATTARPSAFTSSRSTQTGSSFTPRATTSALNSTVAGTSSLRTATPSSVFSSRTTSSSFGSANARLNSTSSNTSGSTTFSASTQEFTRKIEQAKAALSTVPKVRPISINRDGKTSLVTEKQEVTDVQYRRFAAFVEEKCGIVLGDGKQYLVNSRLSSLLSKFRVQTVDDLINLAMEEKPNNKAQEEVIDAMTTNETLWFRDTYPYKALETIILPELAKKAKYPVRIWSAACSSGQEPYSIGMIIQEQMSKMLHIDPKQTQIIGTDLSPEMLSICRRGQYDVHALSRGLSPERKEKFFRPTHNPNMMAIDSRVKSMVEFRPMNLLGSYALMGRFDVIFCRNVLIYFSNDVKADILRKLTMCLNPGGYLILGSTETLVGVADKYEMMRCNPGIIYHLKPQKYAF